MAQKKKNRKKSQKRAGRQMTSQRRQKRAIDRVVHGSAVDRIGEMTEKRSANQHPEN